MDEMSKKEHVEDLDDPEYDPAGEEAPVDETPSPGDADYDWAPHYDGADLYTHQFPNGRVVGMRTFKSIYSKTWLLKMRELPTNVDVELAAIERACCPTAMQVLLSLPDDTDDDYIADLFTAWTAVGTARHKDDKGLTPGE